MISANYYYEAYKLKEAQLIAISIENIQYHAQKKPGLRPIRKLLYVKNITFFDVI